MSLVPPRVWVIANFKETQLRNMRPRQPVQIKVDAYPDHRYTPHRQYSGRERRSVQFVAAGKCDGNT